jgi:hypothetical protein
VGLLEASEQCLGSGRRSLDLLHGCRVAKKSLGDVPHLEVRESRRNSIFAVFHGHCCVVSCVADNM